MIRRALIVAPFRVVFSSGVSGWDIEARANVPWAGNITGSDAPCSENDDVLRLNADCMSILREGDEISLATLILGQSVAASVTVTHGACNVVLAYKPIWPHKGAIP